MNLSRRQKLTSFGFFVLTIFSLTGCSSPVYDEPITGPYRLIAADRIDQLHVCYDLGNGGCLGKIPATTFSVGYGHTYLVAKVNSGSIQNPDIHYYHLDMTVDDMYKNADEITIGPLTEDQYLEAKASLNLPEFSITIDQLIPVPN
ncbi:MAG: hypothetical protein AAF720_07630 [Pseudomonadota bacterium]